MRLNLKVKADAHRKCEVLHLQLYKDQDAIYRPNDENCHFDEIILSKIKITPDTLKLIRILEALVNCGFIYFERLEDPECLIKLWDKTISETSDGIEFRKIIVRTGKTCHLIKVQKDCHVDFLNFVEGE